MRKVISILPLAIYLMLVVLSGLPKTQDGPSLPPAPWEELV